MLYQGIASSREKDSTREHNHHNETPAMIVFDDTVACLIPVDA